MFYVYFLSESLYLSVDKLTSTFFITMSMLMFAKGFFLQVLASNIAVFFSFFFSNIFVYLSIISI